MEKSEYNDQAIQEHHGDHVGTSGQGMPITMSADSREGWQAASPGEAVDGQLSNLPFPSKGYQPTIRKRRADMVLPRRRHTRSFSTLIYLLALVTSLCVSPASAVLIDFNNCLSEAYQNGESGQPKELQFVPLFMDARFNTTDPRHTLQVIVWGNVTGSGPDNLVVNLPAWNDDKYWQSNETNLGGKIISIPDEDSTSPKLTTLSNKVEVLTYEPYDHSDAFCDVLVNATCPLAPAFYANATDPFHLNASNPAFLPSFNFTHDFYSSYAFTSFATTLLIKYGNSEATSIGCISSSITPDLGSTLSGVLTFLPLVVILFVGFATAFAGIFSPWGTTDTFRWTTNYGRDEDLLRLVTPGFGDCLQYIQFIALTGGLSLNYPGFYQPIVSKVSWSALMFNQSFVSNGNGTDSLVDGIYVTHGKYGLDHLRQLVGMNEVTDVWAGMAIWLLVIIAAVLVLIQGGFLLRWVYRHVNKTAEEDLRAKNLPFSVGNVIRIVFNYFLLPIVALSMFQLVVAGKSPAFAVALAVVMLVLILVFGVWLLWFIGRTRPKSYLFDDLPTVLLYGSMYNTYTDNAASFALVPVFVTVVRGVAIGAVQPSGIAQIALLAICEIIFILTLHAFRPFHSPTSMNAYHTFFSALRLTTVFLMISFAPSLGVNDGSKGWIGYAILLMHAGVLVFGFLLNAIQTIVEVGARMAGAGGDDRGAARGGLVKVFGMRQLSRRLPRRDGPSRQSQLSSAAMLNGDDERKSYMMDGSGRLRSQSAGSTGILLNRQSSGLESPDAYGAIPPHQLTSAGSSYTPTTPGEASAFSFLPSAAAPSGLGRDRGPISGIAAAETAHPYYYRPPRARRPTLEGNQDSPGDRSRGSWASADWANKRWSQPGSGTPDQLDEGPSISGRATPILPPQPVDGSDEPRRSQADYTTREVDFYYGVRGPALNANVPSRRIRTGPADPTGPAASAAGWLKSLFGGKTKEKGKGFEVVRSSRMPPGMKRQGEETPPEGVPVATGGVRNGPIDSDDESVHAGPSQATAHAEAVAEAKDSDEDDNLVSPLESEDESSQSGDDSFEVTRISDIPPSIPGLQLPDEGIELPSRFPSKATSKASSRRAMASNVPLVPGLPGQINRTPTVPRKSSRRKSQNVDLAQPGTEFLHRKGQSSLDARLPFERTNSHNRQSTISSNSSMVTPETGGHSRTPSGALGHFGADFRDDRPTSVGYVQHHSIQTVNQVDNPDFLGASAEVVDGGRYSGASSMENQRH
ncbi:putative membrane protein [Lachnellula arida]|uniref:Putative membrane protein n=1 Tax=Lachnellula arida TaxID=1316785 RepID=A0A8T9B5G3_9HELO|nr:putative membrane protein [Lachnellula arida]